jgi:hypothetical protein
LEETTISFSVLPILTPTFPSLELILGVEKERNDFALEGETIPE